MSEFHFYEPKDGHRLPHVLDDEVIDASMADTNDDPTPVPEMHEMKDGKPVTCSFENKVFTERCQRRLNTRLKPASAEGHRVPDLATRDACRPSTTAGLLLRSVSE